jgi:hypothetical protein
MLCRSGAVQDEAETFELADEAVGEFLPEWWGWGWRCGGGRWCPVGESGDVEVTGGGFEVAVVEVSLKLADRAAVLEVSARHNCGARVTGRTVFSMPARLAVSLIRTWSAAGAERFLPEGSDMTGWSGVHRAWPSRSRSRTAAGMGR